MGLLYCLWQQLGKIVLPIMVVPDLVPVQNRFFHFELFL